jgi:DNA-binding XRE family transcriptional regulator
MPRRPRKENEGNPLRQLRVALGFQGKLMPQHELGRILGISPETIKSLEAGRRRKGMPPGEPIRTAVFTYLGALWWPGVGGQEFGWSFPFSGEPYTRAHYEQWKKAPFDRVIEIHALCVKLIALLQAAPDRDFRVVVDTLENAMAEILDRFKLKVELEFSEAALVGDPIYEDDVVTGQLSDVTAYARSRRHLFWGKKRKGKLLDFRHKLGSSEAARAEKTVAKFRVKKF